MCLILYVSNNCFSIVLHFCMGQGAGTVFNRWVVKINGLNCNDYRQGLASKNCFWYVRVCITFHFYVCLNIVFLSLTFLHGSRRRDGIQEVGYENKQNKMQRLWSGPRRRRCQKIVLNMFMIVLCVILFISNNCFSICFSIVHIFTSVEAQGRDQE